MKEIFRKKPKRQQFQTEAELQAIPDQQGTQYNR